MRDTVRPRRRRRRRPRVSKMVQRHVGKNIQRLRLLRGFSQEKLAERANKSGKHLGQIERGLVDVGVNVLYSIAVALSVDVGDLFIGIRRRTSVSDVFLITDRELDQFDRTTHKIRASRTSKKPGPH